MQWEMIIGLDSRPQIYFNLPQVTVCVSGCEDT